ncbi:MAG: hypothetical protein WB680_23165 [Candidatus Acidiferrales bacterium]
MARITDLTLSYITTFLTNNPDAQFDSNGFSREEYLRELDSRADGRAWMDFQAAKGSRIARSKMYSITGDGEAHGPKQL